MSSQPNIPSPSEIALGISNPTAGTSLGASSSVVGNTPHGISPASNQGTHSNMTNTTQSLSIPSVNGNSIMTNANSVSMLNLPQAPTISGISSIPQRSSSVAGSVNASSVVGLRNTSTNPAPTMVNLPTPQARGTAGFPIIPSSDQLPPVPVPQILAPAPAGILQRQNQASENPTLNALRTSVVNSMQRGAGVAPVSANTVGVDINGNNPASVNVGFGGGVEGINADQNPVSTAMFQDFYKLQLSFNTSVQGRIINVEKAQQEFSATTLARLSELERRHSGSGLRLSNSRNEHEADALLEIRDLAASLPGNERALAVINERLAMILIGDRDGWDVAEAYAKQKFNNNLVDEKRFKAAVKMAGISKPKRQGKVQAEGGKLEKMFNELKSELANMMTKQQISTPTRPANNFPIASTPSKPHNQFREYKCYVCHDKGHIAANCPARLSNHSSR